MYAGRKASNMRETGPDFAGRKRAELPYRPAVPSRRACFLVSSVRKLREERRTRLPPPSSSINASAMASLYCPQSLSAFLTSDLHVSGSEADAQTFSAAAWFSFSILSQCSQAASYPCRRGRAPCRHRTPAQVLSGIPRSGNEDGQQHGCRYHENSFHPCPGKPEPAGKYKKGKAQPSPLLFFPHRSGNAGRRRFNMPKALFRPFSPAETPKVRYRWFPDRRRP